MANKRIPRLVKILSGALTETEDDFFQLEGRLEQFTHFWVHVYKNYIRNRCFIRASALSYASLLALIPLLAVAVSVTSSLLKKEGEEKIYQAIDKFVANVMPPANLATNADNTVALKLHPGVTVVLNSNPPPATLTDTNAPAADIASLATDKRVVSAQKSAAKSIHEFVQRTQSGTLGVIGMLALVFVAIRMLASVEATFNDIWGVTRGRSWVWRIVLYWTTITLGPLAIIGALGLAGSSQLHAVKDFFQNMPFIGSLLFDFVPLALLWLVFALMYLLVPNTRVKFSAALVGGIVAGSLWHLNNLFGFLYVSRVVTNSKIYGGLGLVPVFMVGLYFSWAILLFGAQVAHAFQNRKAYLKQKLVENVNQRGREFIALRLMTCLGQRFQAGLRPATIFQLSGELDIPAPIAQSVLRTLAARQLVTEVAGNEPAYAPARPLENITAHDILLVMRTGTGQELPVRDEPALAGIYGEFGRIEQAERAAAAAITLHALANRTPVLPAIAAPQPDHPKEQSDYGGHDDHASAHAAERPTPPASAPEAAQKAKVDLPAETAKVAENAEADSVPPTEAAKLTPKPREVVMPEENREFPL
jgi:membrane protein